MYTAPRANSRNRTAPTPLTACPEQPRILPGHVRTPGSRGGSRRGPAAGLYLGSAGALDPPAALSALLGIGLLSGGAAALNQRLERRLNGLMVRTAGRPFPPGRVRPAEALLLGGALGALGFLVLAAGAGPLAAALGAAIYLGSVLACTP